MAVFKKRNLEHYFLKLALCGNLCFDSNETNLDALYELYFMIFSYLITPVAMHLMHKICPKMRN